MSSEGKCCRHRKCDVVGGGVLSAEEACCLRREVLSFEGKCCRRKGSAVVGGTVMSSEGK